MLQSQADVGVKTVCWALKFLFVCFLIILFIYLFIFGCAGSLVLHGGLLQLQQAEGGYSLAVVCGLLTAVSLIAEHGFWGAQASVVAAHGLSSCGSQALEHRLSSCGSWT